MTTKARRQEADRASQAFHIAMTYEGAQASVEALKLWQDYPQTPTASATASWLAKVVSLIMRRRKRIREIGRAYYRLVSALQTDHTIPPVGGTKEPDVALSELRQDFIDVLPEHTVDTYKPADIPEPDDDFERILIDEIEQLKALEAETERIAQQELEDDLRNLGPGVLNKKLNEMDLEQPARLVDEMRKDAHAQAGARQAAASARVAMNGARNDLHNVIDLHKRVLGYIRISRTGTPCGWCAMLISRGPVYRSKESAEYSEGQQYHDNDNCYSEPVFSRQDYKTNPRYALNRQYQAEWPVVTKGLSGKAAISAWRRYIRLTQRRAAQAAA